MLPAGAVHAVGEDADDVAFVVAALGEAAHRASLRRPEVGNVNSMPKSNHGSQEVILRQP